LMISSSSIRLFLSFEFGALDHQRTEALLTFLLAFQLKLVIGDPVSLI